MALGDGLAEGDALGAGADGVASVLDVGAVDQLVVAREDRGTDAEARVRAVGGGLCGDAARVQVLELRGGQAELLAGGGDGGGIGGVEEGGGGGGHGNGMSFERCRGRNGGGEGV